MTDLLTRLRRDDPEAAAEIERLRVYYDREMLRSAFSSVFWSAISFKRKAEGLTLKEVAERLGVHKSGASRWFSGKSPNWEVNTIADIAGALNLDVKLVAIDRDTGTVFSPSGGWENCDRPAKVFESFDQAAEMPHSTFPFGAAVQLRDHRDGSPPACRFRGTVVGSYRSPVTGEPGAVVSLEHDPGCVQVFPDYMLEARDHD